MDMYNIYIYTHTYTSIITIMMGNIFTNYSIFILITIIDGYLWITGMIGHLAPREDAQLEAANALFAALKPGLQPTPQAGCSVDQPEVVERFGWST